MQKNYISYISQSIFIIVHVVGIMVHIYFLISGLRKIKYLFVKVFGHVK